MMSLNVASGNISTLSASSPSTSAASTLRYSPTSKLFHCGQGTCDYSSKVKSNVTRHQKSTCLREAREEWKLKQRTCQQCGQVLMQAKFMKKHQLTKYCSKQRDLKRKGEATTMYKYSKWIIHSSKRIYLGFEDQINFVLSLSRQHSTSTIFNSIAFAFFMTELSE